MTTTPKKLAGVLFLEFLKGAFMGLGFSAGVWVFISTMPVPL